VRVYVDNELCGTSDKEVGKTEKYVATELMKNQVHVPRIFLIDFINYKM
jgi:hypothetical protein